MRSEGDNEELSEEPPCAEWQMATLLSRGLVAVGVGCRGDVGGARSDSDSVPCSCASLRGAQEPLVVQCDSLFIYNIYVYKTVSSSQQQTFTLKAFHCLSLWVDEVIMCRIPGGRGQIVQMV